jgi:hypothetical protein
MTDEQLRYWADRYHQLNRRYGLYRTHRFTFAQFITRPHHYQRWIPLYGDNPALFSRPGGGRVLLGLFLTDPEWILQALLCQPGYDDREQPRPLLKKQRWVKYRLEWVEQIEWRLAQHDKIPARLSGGRLVQPMKHFEPTPKYKTRGAHR